MSQQDLNAFADWLVANQSKKGTPEFETVANAFVNSMRSSVNVMAPLLTVSTVSSAWLVKASRLSVNWLVQKT